MWTDYLLLVALYIWRAFWIYLSTSFLAAIFSVFQERKIWKSRGIPDMSLFGLLKVYLLNAIWMTFCLLGSVLVVLKSILTLNFQGQETLAHAGVERSIAKLIVLLFVGPVEIRGTEHLPPIDGSSKQTPAPVFIANHASQIDACVVYHLNRRFRWIAKSSILYLPGVGQIMWLSGHVFIDRVKKSKGVTGARNLYVKSNKSVQEGIPMFFFPQGTRRMDERLPFKDGAFKIALENKSPLIPISIDIPTSAWNSWYPFGKAAPIVLTVHPPIEVTEQSELEDLKTKSFDTIFSVLPDYSKQS
jgi:lysophosphatidate acyltransferase